ncbi:hypothetical protein [Allosphingosinicella indica]|uniref:Phage shock protein B n=1 Tax=Allosphingosinicella indica TaxID=941907 RepID=A0A1X7FXA2_9SPHN|nr:hypothetical protein [Allosphingosinicella indica]SMF60413.1 hypothetical protein SAMN06295910_0004 [Allosphingosinicella indica]
MNFGSPIFVIAIIVICTAGWVVTTWIRAKHGYPIEDQFWGMSEKTESPDAARAAQLMAEENARLKGQIGRLEERIAVMERIVTDPAERTAAEIEKLR